MMIVDAEPSIDDVCAGHPMAMVELQRLRAVADRYETARLLNPRHWKDAWELSISTGKPFDDIIDDVRPFLRPDNRGIS